MATNIDPDAIDVVPEPVDTDYSHPPTPDQAYGRPYYTNRSARSSRASSRASSLATSRASSAGPATRYAELDEARGLAPILTNLAAAARMSLAPEKYEKAKKDRVARHLKKGVRLSALRRAFQEQAYLTDSSSDDEEEAPLPNRHLEHGPPAEEPKVIQIRRELRAEYGSKFSTRGNEKLLPFLADFVNSCNASRLNFKQQGAELKRFFEGGQKAVVETHLKYKGITGAIEFLRSTISGDTNEQTYQKKLKTLTKLDAKGGSIRDHVLDINSWVIMANPGLTLELTDTITRVKVCHLLPDYVESYVRSEERRYQRSHKNHAMPIHRFAQTVSEAMARNPPPKEAGIRAVSSQAMPAGQLTQKPSGTSGTNQPTRDAQMQDYRQGQPYLSGAHSTNQQGGYPPPSQQPQTYGAPGGVQYPGQPNAEGSFLYTNRGPPPGTPVRQLPNFLVAGTPAYEEAKRQTDKGAFLRETQEGYDFAGPNELLPYSWQGEQWVPNRPIEAVANRYSTFVQLPSGKYEFGRFITNFFKNKCVACGLLGHSANHNNCPMKNSPNTWDLCSRCRTSFHSPKSCNIDLRFVLNA